MDNYNVTVNQAKIADSIVLNGETFTNVIVSVNLRIELEKDGRTVFENIELPLSKPQSNNFKSIETVTSEYLKNLVLSANTVKVENLKMLLKKRLEHQLVPMQNTEPTYIINSDFS
jgi:hypothetical protein